MGGDVLKDTKEEFQEPCLYALELMKFGLLNGEALEPVEDRRFPHAINYPKQSEGPQRWIMLISRVCSLVPMRLKSEMWNADVDFDLAAFHCQVRLLLRSLRQLTEACTAFFLLENVQRMKYMPPHANNPVSDARRKSSKDDSNRAVFPTFMLPRACAGIVLKKLLQLNAQGPQPQVKNQVDAELKKFGACLSPREDLHHAINFWKEVLKCVEKISEQGLEAQDLLQDMRAADDFLESKRRTFNL